MRTLLATLLLVLTLVAAAPTSADDQVNYVSQPESLTVFLNGIAFARDFAARTRQCHRPHRPAGNNLSGHADRPLCRRPDSQLSRQQGQRTNRAATDHQTRAEFQI